MLSNPDTATSSRLPRSTNLSKVINAQIEGVSAETISQCHQVLDRSHFFTLLKNQTVPLQLLQYIFLQYHHWREQLHQWFGLCIIKADSCNDPDQKAAIMALADHTFTDLQDGHSEMFLEFLHDIGLNDAVIQESQRSIATITYERSFFDDFGYGTENFYEALASLSGRELCVSIRNQRILGDYFDAYGLKHPTWLALHAQLEVDHFLDHIRPGIIHYADDSTKIDALNQAIAKGVARHIKYFDDLVAEYAAQIATADIPHSLVQVRQR